MAAVARHGRLTPGLDAAEVLRAQVREVHRELDEGLNDWQRALGLAAPPTGSRVVALYVHAATVEDVTIQSLLRRVAPVYQTDWDGRGPARYATDDLVPVRAYAQQVFAATDAYLAGLAPAALSNTVDLTRFGQGRPTVAWVVSKFVILQLAQIYGELTSGLESRLRSGQRSVPARRLLNEPQHLATLRPDDQLALGDLQPDRPSAAELFAKLTREP